MSGSIGLERNIAAIECTLSNISVVPGIGIISGALKIVLGVIQTIGGIIAYLGSFLFLKDLERETFGYRAIGHIINGFANIIAGALEAIPVVGSVIFIYRQVRQIRGSDPTDKVLTGQEGMIFVGYHILHKNPNALIIGGDDMSMEEAARRNIPSENLPYHVFPMFMAG